MVGYRQTNQKTDTGKTLTRWPVFVDHFSLMYPLNWSTSENGEWETFMLKEMVCGDVTEIYARYGARYFRLRDVCNLSHAQITTRIKEEFNLFRK